MVVGYGVQVMVTTPPGSIVLRQPLGRSSAHGQLALRGFELPSDVGPLPVAAYGHGLH
jgi:hypothetical protein